MDSHIAVGTIELVALLAGYWVPSIVAWRRHAPNTGSVAAVNLFFGWTVIGWIVAFAMAMRDPRRTA